MALFASKIAKAKASFGANYGREGRYLILLNAGKADKHASTGSEQIIFEGLVMYVFDPGPPAGSRFKPTKGNNETPHTPGEPYSFYFSEAQLGSESRCKSFLLTAFNIKEKDLPVAVNPENGATVAVPVGMWIDKVSGAPVVPGTPGAVAAVDPIEYAISQATSPTVNSLRDVMIEVNGRGTKTQGRGKSGVQDIIAVDYVRRVWAREVRELWTAGKLHDNAIQEFNRNKRFEQMLTREAAENPGA